MVKKSHIQLIVVVTIGSMWHSRMQHILDIIRVLHRTNIAGKLGIVVLIRK